MTAIENEASRRLKQYIEDHSDARTGEKLPLVLKGERELLDVFKIPIDYLTYNVKNGRLRVDVLRYKRQTSKEIDPWSGEGRTFLKDRLLATAGGDELLLSLDQRGQVEPGLATYDGVVINANRRMAALSELRENCDHHPPGKHDYILVAILKPEISQEELYRIEADLQFGFDFKEKYGPMNELLKIREGGAFESVAQLAASLGKKKEEIETKLRILELIDDYLAQTGQPNEYELVADEETYSHFAELPSLLKKLGASGRDDETVAKYLVLAFTLIKGGSEHREVRQLKKICELPEAMESRVLELSDAGALQNPPDKGLCQRIENRMDEGNTYIQQELEVNAPVDIVEDLIGRLDALQLKKGAPYLPSVLGRLKTLQERIGEKIASVETAK
ncbi:MAG: hypothetical protein JRN32_01780 [Nitrososphaerota archaeon]|jgi:hypothetical protein|nr:hypothetical protein [Nitrososphaerota archaeon]